MRWLLSCVPTAMIFDDHDNNSGGAIRYQAEDDIGQDSSEHMFWPIVRPARYGNDILDHVYMYAIRYGTPPGSGLGLDDYFAAVWHYSSHGGGYIGAQDRSYQYLAEGSSG